MLTQLRENVWWLDLRGVNAYLVDDGGTLTLVDAGPPWQSGAVLDGVVEAGYALDDLDRVLLTHYDVDHVGGLSRLAGLGVEAFAGRPDAGLVSGSASPDVGTWKGLFHAVTGATVSDSPVPVHPLDDGDRVGSFTVYATPGHTRGHVAYVSEALETAVLGDMVRESGGRLVVPPWYLNDGTDAARESVVTFAERCPPFEVAAVGHGVPFERGGSDRLAELAERL